MPPLAPQNRRPRNPEPVSPRPGMEPSVALRPAAPAEPISSPTEPSASPSQVPNLVRQCRHFFFSSASCCRGQMVVASLLNRNIKSRLLLREPEKATAIFGEQYEETLQVCQGNTRSRKDLDPSIFEGVTHTA